MDEQRQKFIAFMDQMTRIAKGEITDTDALFRYARRGLDMIERNAKTPKTPIELSEVIRGFKWL